MKAKKKQTENISQYKKKISQLETAYEVTSLLNSELNLKKLLDTIMKISKKVMGADACSLLLIDDEQGDLIFQVALSGVGSKLKTMNRLKIGQGIAGTVAETGEPIIVEDAYEHPKFNKAYDKKTGFRTGSILCAPLKTKDKLIGVCQVIHNRDKGIIFSPGDLALFRLFCDSAGLAIQNARMHQVMLDQQRQQRDMEFATSVQESFLPQTLPKHERFKFAAKSISAMNVGGDYYDFIPFTNETLGILLGDVSGKGVPAALQMAKLMSDFRYVSQHISEPKDLLYEVNNAACERFKMGMFTTATYILLDLKHNRMKISNAGHLSMLFQKNYGKVIEIGKATGAPLGILPNTRYEQEEVDLDSGDRALLYTDGVTESQNAKGVQLGLKRLMKIMAKDKCPPEQFLKSVEAGIKELTGKAPQFDDTTLLSFQAL
ncbi:MAG: GAF domain-containing SpoIIE family protein phosphatase [Nitrospinales bacterium]